MYKIEHLQINNQKHIQLTSSNKNSYAIICLNKGGSLNELAISNKVVIEDLAPLQYSDTYASSILFPFANRIKNGKYIFKNP